LIPQISESFPGHVDIPRMREGRLGGAFWTVWTPCHDHVAGDTKSDFTGPSDALRNAFEMLDLIQNMIKQHLNDLQYAYTSQDIRDAHRAGKIASLIGMEGTHFLGNSLGVLRIFAQMGVRYVTLTHVCHSAFASSAGAGVPLEQIHPKNGLTDLGRELIMELNRLGILVDLSHTSDETAKQAITLSKAPVIWTHSGSRAMWHHARNVPDDVLAMIGDSSGQKDGLVQSVFYPPFIGPSNGANLTRVADHIEYIAAKIGKSRVGIASDFDGMYAAVDGLEDATKYPDLASSPLMFVVRANMLRLRRCCFGVGQTWK
jgi:membrane dipeptidase